MRTSTILTAVLAGGALATPVKRWLEERAIVVNYVTTTTVVWVTEGQPKETVAPVTANKAAVAYYPHRHPHAHAAAQPAQPVQSAQPPEPSTTPPPAPPPSSPAPVAPAPEAVQPPAEQPESTSTPPAPATSPNTNSGSSGSAQGPTNYPDNLDTTSDTYKVLTLQHHNIHRANHSADDLVWDDTLASYAEQSAKTCTFAHDL